MSKSKSNEPYKDTMEGVNEELRKYFDDGFAYMEIIEMLRVRHDVSISLSTLKRYFKKNKWKRRALETVRSSIYDIRQAIQTELDGSGQGLGYRRIHRILTGKGIICRREDVRKLLLELDRESVDLRRNRRLHRRKYVTRGPNYVWHIDGHDKLKPFGFSIHGCIDGFSRKLIWLEVGPSNKLPEVIAQFYMESVSKYGCPRYVKADAGTEHALIEPIHIALRMTDDDEDLALNSFSIITSPQNQRIEAYWSILRRDKIGWWKRFFEDFADLDMFMHDPVLVDCIRFCFMPLIRRDLQSIQDDWNVHLISKSQNRGIRGRPDTMYYLPHLYESEDYRIDIEQADYDDIYPCTNNNVRDVTEEFEEFARVSMDAREMDMPNSVDEALNLYTYLLEKIEEYS